MIGRETEEAVILRDSHIAFSAATGIGKPAMAEKTRPLRLAAGAARMMLRLNE
jgi:hypothetical protein